MIYLYAITDPLALAVGATGLEDAPLQTLEAGELAGVYTTHEGLEFSPEPSLLWRHDQVIEQLMEMGAVLPLRFGTVLEHADQLRAILLREQDRFRSMLERVRGCVELAVRVGLPVEPEAPVPDGAAYMQTKLAAQRERERVASGVFAPLRELATATSARKPLGNGGVVSESYLVKRDVVEPFVATVRDLQVRHKGLAVSCTGPWGPYSFVDEVER